MTNSPSYLPLLNRIAHAEADAECYLSAWAAVTPRDEVRQAMTVVALREGEHGKAFAKRICELGYGLTAAAESKAAERMPIASSTTLSDREKFEQLGFGQPTDPSKPDPFTPMFADATIDIQTGALLGRYIAEERDSARLFRGVYEQLCADDNAAPTPAEGTVAQLDRIERLLENLAAKIAGTSDTVTEAEFRTALRADGFDDEIRITNYEAGVEAAALHAHDFSARIYVLDGAFTILYENGPQTFTAGQYCQLNAGTMHAETTGASCAKVLAGLKHHS